MKKIADILLEWTISRDGVIANTKKSNRTSTRFTTKEMNEILPDIPNAPSGWNTDNHYFYEITNRTGKKVYIQFTISSQNITDEFRSVCDSINSFFPAKIEKENWQWRSPFKTSSVEIKDNLSKEAIFAGLDNCLKEIKKFESELKQKLDAAKK